MHWAFGCDLDQLAALLRRQVALQIHLHVDAVEHAVSRFTILAIFRVNARVAQRHRHIFERPFLAPRVEADCHGSARAEAGEKIIVGSRRGLGPAKTNRLIGTEVMRADLNVLEKAARVSANHDIGLCCAWRVVGFRR